MIEKIIYDYLVSKNIPVYLQVPAEPPTEYVLIEKTGSGKRNHIKSAMIALQSYADSLYSAALLNETVKEAMDDAIELDDISNTTLNSDYNFTDNTTKKYRYQAVYDIIHY